jgi:hypothetical protein
VDKLTVSSSAAVGSGDLVISNTGNLAVVSVSTLSDVSLSSTGAITDAASDTVLDISAAGLTLVAATGVTGLETQVTTLNVIATSGDVSLVEADALTINSVDAQGTTSTVTLTVGGAVVAGSGTAANVLANSLVLSSVGAVGAVGTAGALRTDVDKLTVSSSAAVGSGDLVISNTGNLAVVSVSTLSDVSLTSTGGITDASNDSTVNISASELTLSAVTGAGTLSNALEVDADALTLSVSAGGAHVVNAGDLIVRSAQTTDTLSVALTGETSALTVSGALTVTSGDVNLLTPTGVRFIADGSVNRGAGSDQPATMTLASSVKTKAIVIADDLSGATGAWTLSTAELAKLGQSFETVVVGGSDYEGDISMSGANMVFADPVEIQTSGTVQLSGHLSAQTLAVNASSAGNATVQIDGDTVLSVSGLALGAGVTIGGSSDSASLTIQGLSTGGRAQGIVLGGQDASGTALVLGSNLTNALSATLKQVKVGTGEQSVSVTGDIAFAQSVALDAQRLDMAGAATLTVAGNVVLSSAAGMSLGGISAQGHTVTIADTGAQVSSAGTGVNVTAGSVVFSGWGPASGSSAAALQVNAASVQVYAPSGMVLRDTGTDGKVTYLVVNGDQVQKQLVSVNGNVSVRAETVASTTQTPQAPMILALSTTVTAARVSAASVAPASVLLSGLNLNEDANATTHTLAAVGWGGGRALAAVDDLSGGADVVAWHSDGSLPSVQSIGADALGITIGTSTEPVVTTGLSDAAVSAAHGYTAWTEALSL